MTLARRMLCAVCEPITASRLSDDTYDHQPSLAALKSSAEANCSFCKLIWASLVKDTDLRTILAYCDQEVSGEEEDDKKAVDTGVRLSTINPLIPYHHTKGFQPEEVPHFTVYVGIGTREDTWKNTSTGIEGKLRLYARLGDSAAQHFHGREVAEAPTADSCFHKIKQWLSHCDEKHKYCGGASSRRLPTRVVDVGPAEGSANPRLYITRDEVARYVALSYCWGAAQTVVTTEQTLEDYTVNIDVSTLSPSLRDAISITRALGLRYIWIDALCIIQQQPDLTDFKAEALKMEQYYSNAYLTLIAGNAADSRDGFLNDRPPAAAEACGLDYFFWDITRSVWTHKVGSVYACLPSSIDLGPIEKRAWTHQEAVLSHRKLSYGREQIWFECQAMLAYEDGSSLKVAVGQSSARDGATLPSLLTAARDPDLARRQREMYRLWYRNLLYYTTRTMTNPDDKFAALAGIADLVQKTVLSRYLFGLWEDDMVRGLLWQSCMFHAWGRYRVPLQPRRGSPLPSWSWASVEGPIWVDYPENKDSRFSKAENLRVKMLSMNHATDSLDPIHSETLVRRSFELKLQGILKRVHATNPDKFLNSSVHRWRTYKQLKLRAQVTALVPETALHSSGRKDKINDPSRDDQGRVIGLGYFDFVDDAHSHDELWCMQLIREEGLLLQHCGDGTYRRLGLLVVVDDDWFGVEHGREITLV